MKKLRNFYKRSNNTHLFPRENSAGVVFIVAVFVLVCLCLLGLLFVASSKMEMSAAKNASDHTQLSLAADAGIEKAIAFIYVNSKKSAYSDTRDSLFYKDNWRLSLEEIQNPSLKEEFAYSGKIQCSDNLKILYVLKVFPSNSLININDRNPNLEKILVSLFQILGVPEKAAHLIVQSRGLRGYRHKRELIGIIEEKEYNLIQNFITTLSWADENSIKPGSFDRAFLPDDWVESRCPINLNTAPPEIIAAVLTNISAMFSGQLIKIEPQQAYALAKSVVSQREQVPFTTWETWEKFLQNSDGLNKLQAQMIYANTNPNVLLNKHNPDFHLFRDIDKLDVDGYTCEFCLGSFDGLFEIECLAKLVMLDGNIVRVLGSIKKACRVQIFKSYRHRTQQDFVLARRLSNYDKNTAITLPIALESDDSNKAHRYLGGVYRGNPYGSCQYRPQEYKIPDGVLSRKNSVITSCLGKIEQGEFEFFF